MDIRKKKNSYSFAELLKGFQDTVNSAQELLEVQQLNNFHHFFDKEGKALTEEIKIGAGKSIEVPLMSLIPQNSLIMDEVEIEFDAKLDEVIPKFTKGEHFESSITQAEISLSHPSEKDNRLIHVKVHFKSAETPEGISRILDENNKFL